MGTKTVNEIGGDWCPLCFEFVKLINNKGGERHEKQQ